MLRCCSSELLCAERRAEDGRKKRERERERKRGEEGRRRRRKRRGRRKRGIHANQKIWRGDSG